MTTKKRVGVPTAIKHVLDILDSASPETAAVALVRAVEAVENDLGYDHDEAVRLTRWLAGQSKDANPFDLTDEWCHLCRLPWDSCKHVPPLSIGVQLAMAEVAKKPEPPKPLSLEEQRRILHETGLFDEMGNFKGI